MLIIKNWKILRSKIKVYIIFFRGILKIDSHWMSKSPKYFSSCILILNKFREERLDIKTTNQKKINKKKSRNN